MNILGWLAWGIEFLLLVLVFALIFFPPAPSSTLTTHVYMDAVIQGVRIGYGCARRGDPLGACERQLRAYERP